MTASKPDFFYLSSLSSLGAIIVPGGRASFTYGSCDMLNLNVGGGSDAFGLLVGRDSNSFGLLVRGGSIALGLLVGGSIALGLPVWGGNILGLHVIRWSRWRVHFVEIFWHELDPTLVETKCVSEMASM